MRARLITGLVIMFALGTLLLPPSASAAPPADLPDGPSPARIAQAKADTAAAAASFAAQMAAAQASSSSAPSQKRDTVTCGVDKQKPVTSGSGSSRAITGVGKWTGCVPHAPMSCSLQAYLMIYIDGDFEVWAQGPDIHTCPGGKSSATTSCVATSKTYRFKTRVQAIIAEDGDVEGDWYYSAESSFKCY